MRNKVYLVDGSGYIFRAYFAIAPLSTTSGFPTNALFGFTRMLLKLLSRSDSDHVVVAFDAGRETFRTEIYPEYKANREECPADLLKQMPHFREIAMALGLPIMELKGFEADDLIGTLTRKFAEAGYEVVIVSGDKDLMQLVGAGVSVWDTMRDKIYREGEVREKFGVPPGQVVEVLGLSGDSSDNVPGLKGVGPKTAQQLVEKYGGVEQIIAAQNAIKDDVTIRNRKKIAEAIELNAELLRLSRKLVEINTRVPLEIQCRDVAMPIDEAQADELHLAVQRHVPDPARLHELFSKFEFTSLLKDFNLHVPAPAEELARRRFEIVFKPNFESWLAQLKQQELFAFDLETTSLDPLEARVVGASFSWSEDEAFYIPIGHRTSKEQQLEFNEFVKRVGPLLADPRIGKLGQNVKYDMEVLAQQGIELNGVIFDSMLASYLLNPDKGSHNLSSLAHDFLGHTMVEYDEVTRDCENFADTDIEAAARYAGDDARVVFCLYRKLSSALKEQELEPVLREVELPLIGVLARMELKGISIDAAYLAALSEDLASRLEKLKAQLFAMAGCEFNVNSPKQLSDVLFNKLGISTKGLKKTKSGTSTDSSVLEKLSSDHPLPAKILEYRSLFKLKSTYVDALPAQLSAHTGRLHTRFNQTVTGTGRLSSSEPNLQNIPIQTEEGRKIRRAFRADPGRCLISADYSQIELRLLAHLSGDENLIRAFVEGQDIHSSTARELMGLAADAEVSPELRRIGKTINFGIIYGMGAFRLARELGIPVNVANRYIEDYFARFPGVRKLFAKIEENANSLGYVTTLLGRKRFTANIDSSGRDQGFVLRAALNAPFQGSAADIVKLAMIRLDRVLREEGMAVDMLLQIHDELLFECDLSMRDAAIEVVRREMEGVMQLKVPLKVEVGTGSNWEEAHG